MVGKSDCLETAAALNVTGRLQNAEPVIHLMNTFMDYLRTFNQQRTPIGAFCQPSN